MSEVLSHILKAYVRELIFHKHPLKLQCRSTRYINSQNCHTTMLLERYPEEQTTMNTPGHLNMKINKKENKMKKLQSLSDKVPPGTPAIKAIKGC